MEKTQLQNYHVHYGPAQGWSRVDLRELWRYKDLIWLPKTLQKCSSAFAGRYADGGFLGSRVLKQTQSRLDVDPASSQGHAPFPFNSLGIRL